ncbi:MAG TPA: DUF6644 family protein [Rhizomicrobium sp.]|jgi:hypothetical protein
MSLYAQFQALDSSALATGIKGSLWLFPAIEAVHLLALALLGGAVLMLDLRLLGAGLIRQPVAAVERNARPWLIGAIATLIVTGVLIGISEALKLYDKDAFWVKMAALAVVLVFTFAVKLPMARRGVSGLAAKVLATLSILLWLTVAMAGRWIGFS